MSQTRRRWQFTEAEREQARETIGRLLLGPRYDPTRPIIEQAREQLGGLFLGQRLGFLAGSNPRATPEKPRETPEWEKMPEDYAGGPEGWAMLSEAEKRAIHEALKVNRKIYIAISPSESQRGSFDGLWEQRQKIERAMKGY